MNEMKERHGNEKREGKTRKLEIKKNQERWKKRKQEGKTKEKQEGKMDERKEEGNNEELQWEKERLKFVK